MLVVISSYSFARCHKEQVGGTCPVVQWFRPHLPIQWVWVRFWGVKISHALVSKHQNVKQRQYYNKFNKNFKNGPHFKKYILKKEHVGISYSYSSFYLQFSPPCLLWIRGQWQLQPHLADATHPFSVASVGPATTWHHLRHRGGYGGVSALGCF